MLYERNINMMFVAIDCDISLKQTLKPLIIQSTVGIAISMQDCLRMHRTFCDKRMKLSELIYFDPLIKIRSELHLRIEFTSYF